MAAGVAFHDVHGQVLSVEPSYIQANREIPGGAVEADESSWATASRELAEELGWQRPVGRLLVVDYVRQQDSGPEGVYWLDGGVLDETDLMGLSFRDAEIVSVALCTRRGAREGEDAVGGPSPGCVRSG